MSDKMDTMSAEMIGIKSSISALGMNKLVFSFSRTLFYCRSFCLRTFVREFHHER